MAEATEALQSGSLDQPAVEAALLVSHGLGVDRAALYTGCRDEVRNDQVQTVMELIIRRGKHEPGQYLTGRVNFLGFDFLVKAPVFIPRPETEVLVEKLVELAHSTN
jgi:release factor glutamine methyltransferase